MQHAWNKYGESKFKFDILELVNNRDELIEREQYWIDKTQCYKRNIGYNIAQFADTNLRRLSEKTIKKIADLHKQGVHYKKIAEITGVSIATIHEIKNGHIYNEITGFKKIEYKPNKLNEEEVKYIARICKKAVGKGIEIRSIAEILSKEFGVSESTIYDINRGRTWGEVTGIKYDKEYKQKTENEVRYIARVCKNAVKRGIELKNIAKRLSKEYEISESTIYDINQGRTWREITGIEYKREYDKKTQNEIKNIYSDIKNGKPLDYICKRYNVSKRYINRILRGEIWSDITGIKYKRNRLTEEQVKEIYIRKHNGEKTSTLAKEFNVTPQTINRIKNKKIWKEVTKDIAI